MGTDTGNMLWADGIRRLATITEATDYAEGVRRTSVAQFEKRCGQMVSEERYNSDVTDFRTQLTKLLNEAPDALHIAAQSEFTAGTIVKQARELGYEGPIYGEAVTAGATALEIAGDAATGVKVISADIDPANNKGLEVLAKPESTDGLGCAGCRARNGRLGGCGSGWWRWQGATVAVRACGQEETAVGRRSQACWRQAVERSARPSGVRSGAGSPAAGRGRR